MMVRAKVSFNYAPSLSKPGTGKFTNCALLESCSHHVLLSLVLFSLIAFYIDMEEVAERWGLTKKPVEESASSSSSDDEEE